MSKSSTTSSRRNVENIEFEEEPEPTNQPIRRHRAPEGAPSDKNKKAPDPTDQPTKSRFTEIYEYFFGSGIPEAKYSNKATGDVAKNWDFLAARKPGKRTTVLESVGHLIKSCLGGGIVSIHEAYASCGLWVSTGLNVVLGFMVSYAMIMLARSAQVAYGRTQVPTMTYPDLAEAALLIGPFPKLRKFSKCFRYMVDATIMIDLYGSCCCYMVIISRGLHQLIEGTDSTVMGYNDIRKLLACLILPCILICMILSLKYLAPFSLVADLVIISVAVATVVYGIQASTVAVTEMPVYKSVPGLFEFMGVCVFSMEGVGVTLAVENNMQDPKKIIMVLTIGMSVVVSMVMMVGFFGNWGFGDAAKAPITLNFPRSPFTIILKAAIPAMIYVTFALNFWVPFELSWYYLKKRHAPNKHWYVERIYRTIFVVGISGIAIAFPEVSKLIGVIGAFCLSNMGFIYPAFIELCLDWTDPGLGTCKWRLWKSLFFIVFGILLMCIGTVINMKDLIDTVYGKTVVATTMAPNATLANDTISTTTEAPGF